MPVERTVADWQSALGWGRRLSGPCPLCGGRDRFHLAKGRRHACVVGCRRCDMSGDWIRRVADAVFGPSDGSVRPMPPPPTHAMTGSERVLHEAQSPVDARTEALYRAELEAEGAAVCTADGRVLDELPPDLAQRTLDGEILR